MRPDQEASSCSLFICRAVPGPALASQFWQDCVSSLSFGAAEVVMAAGLPVHRHRRPHRPAIQRPLRAKMRCWAHRHGGSLLIRQRTANSSPIQIARVTPLGQMWESQSQPLQRDNSVGKYSVWEAIREWADGCTQKADLSQRRNKPVRLSTQALVSSWQDGRQPFQFPRETWTARRGPQACTSCC